MLALLLAACGGPSPATAGFEVGVVPSTLSVERGDEAGVEVRVQRTGSFTGAIDVVVSDAPEGLTFSGGRVPAGATSATLTVTVAADVAPGDRSVTLSADADELEEAEDTTALTVRVTAETPTVTDVAVWGTAASRQLRQGEGQLRVVLSGVDLDTVEEVVVADLGATLEDEPEAVSLTLTVEIPYATELGQRDIVLVTAAGSVTIENALEVVPLTAGPGGDDTARGTPDDPFERMQRALELARDGDVVLLLAGTYGTSSGEVFPEQTLLTAADPVSFTNVPAGVTIRGEGPDVTLISRVTNVDLPTLVAFAPEGDVRLESLAVVGFGHAVSASVGTIELVDVHMRDGATGVRAVGQANLVMRGTTRVDEVNRGLILTGAARADLQATEIVSATSFGIFLGGQAQLDATDALIRRSSYGIRAQDEAVVNLRDSLVEQPAADAGVGGGVWGLDSAVLDLRGSTVQRFQAGIVAEGQRLFMRDTTVRENVIGLAIPDVSPRSSWQPARVYDLGTASDAGGNALIENVDYQLVDARPEGARQTVTVSATTVGANVPSDLLLSGPVDAPPLWTIVNDGVAVQFW